MFPTVVLLLPLIAVAVTLWRLIYNIYFHPLAKIPGPKWAGATSLWLFMKEMSGNCHTNTLALHRKYGPLVRISPGELSISDLDAYLNHIYAQNTRFTKAQYFYGAFDNPRRSVFSEPDKSVHAAEKRLMSHAFSRANILGMQRQLYQNTHRWIGQLQKAAESNRSIPLWHATQCLTLDTTSIFSFGSSDGALDLVDFHHPFFESLDKLPRAVAVLQQFPLLQPVCRWVQKYVPTGVEGIMQRLELQKRKGETVGMIMFDSMSEQAARRNVKLDPNRLISNGQLMLTAGTGTTAAALTTAIHHLVAQPDLWKELQAMLLDTFPDPSDDPDVPQLEKIPLLEACVKEALRLGNPIRGRHPRVVPEEGWTYKSWDLPKGTIISAATMYHCFDPDVFPEPNNFNPKRWLIEDTKLMQQSNLIFSHGSRSCIGQNLAQVELKLALSQVIMKFDPGQLIDKTLDFAEFVGLSIPRSLVHVTLKPHSRKRDGQYS